MIAILDVPGGGAQALLRAFQRLDADVQAANAIVDVKLAAKIVIPDSDSFPGLIRWLRDSHLVGPILLAAEQGRPILGVGRGLHLLFDVYHDTGQHTGLGLIPGKVIPLDLGRHPAAQHFLIPHRGPNQVRWAGDGPLTSGLPSGEFFFFDHAAHAEPLDAAQVGATCNHGIDFCALAWRERVFGVQFLPEKSEAAGLKILGNFAGL